MRNTELMKRHDKNRPVEKKPANHWKNIDKEMIAVSTRRILDMDQIRTDIPKRTKKPGQIKQPPGWNGFDDLEMKLIECFNLRLIRSQHVSFDSLRGQSGRQIRRVISDAATRIWKAARDEGDLHGQDPG